MNCPVCGALLQPGAQVCPVCNTPVQQAGYPQGYPQGYQPYPQGYPQGYQQYPQGYQQPAQPPLQAQPPMQGQPSMQGQQPYPQGYGYPQGYQQAYPQYKPRGAFLSALERLPHLLLDAIRDPGTALQGIVERADVYTGPTIAGLALLLTFFAALVVTRGAIGALIGGLSAITGTSFAGDATSLNQGVSFIAGKIAPSVGGNAVLCQLFAMAIPAAVAMIYLCAIRKVRFSWPLLCGFVAITTIPTLAVALLSMVLSLLTPALALACIFVGQIMSYVLMAALIARVTGKSDAELVTVKMLCIGIAAVATLLFVLLVGGGLLGVTFKRMSGMLGSSLY